MLEGAYIILEREFSRDDPSYWNEEHNLVLAVRKTSVEILKYILQEGSLNPGEILTGQGISMIAISAIYGSLEVFELLIADPRVRLPQDLLAKTCDPHVESEDRIDNHACLRAVSEHSGGVEIMRLLLADPRIDPVRGGALVYATKKFRPKIVELLLSDSRIDPSDGNDEALRECRYNVHSQVARLLLADPSSRSGLRSLVSRVNPSVEGNIILQRAVDDCNANMVRFILANLRIGIKKDRDILLCKCSASNNLVIREIIVSALE